MYSLYPTIPYKWIDSAGAYTQKVEAPGCGSVSASEYEPYARGDAGPASVKGSELYEKANTGVGTVPFGLSLLK